MHQPNYIPWIGFFDKMDKSDIFVILDNPEFNRRGWTHRNRIKTPNGELLLSVPIRVKDDIIRKVIIDNSQLWKHKHIGSLQKNYARSTYWTTYKDDLTRIYNGTSNFLVDLTIPLILFLKSALSIKTTIVLESELGMNFGSGNERIVGICKHLGADVYLSGIGAKAYNETTVYESLGIRLQYQDFRHPEYPQLWGTFINNMSILDLLFNCGPDSMAVVRRYNP